jgi:glycosyltransferase involved in cell wall biosynthesis
VRYGGARPQVITNAFPLQLPPAHSKSERPTSFFWFSQTLGPGRGLEPFLTAWSIARRPSQLVLLGEDRCEFRRTLIAQLPTSHRARVEFQPLVAPHDLPAEIARHDVGLALEDKTIRNRDLTITNKILQYLNAGLAIVATGTAGHQEVLAHSPDAGVFIDLSDPVATANVLDGLLADLASLESRQRSARRLAEQVYSWEIESPKLLRLVERALQTR